MFVAFDIPLGYEVSPLGFLRRGKKRMNDAPVVSARESIMQHLTAAQKSLQQAYSMGVQTNPMAQDLPVFKQMQSLGSEVSSVMQQVAKVRGL